MQIKLTNIAIIQTISFIQTVRDRDKKKYNTNTHTCIQPYAAVRKGVAHAQSTLAAISSMNTNTSPQEIQIHTNMMAL